MLQGRKMKYYYSVKRNFPISWLIIGITVPALAMLAWNQFNWLEELQIREKTRIQARMIDAAQSLAKRVKEEFYYLPSVFRLRDADTRDTDSVIAERYDFWKYYSTDPDLLSGLYLVDSASLTARRWDGSAFRPSKIPEGISLPPEGSRQHTYFTAFATSSGTDFSLLLPVEGTDRRNLYVLCTLDENVLTRSVIPQVAEETLGSSDTYAFRIEDVSTGTALWASEGAPDDPVFNRIDLDVPLLGQIDLPAFEQGPSIRLERISGDFVQVFSFIKQRVKIDNSVPPDDVPPQLFVNFRLQIANRDASLAALSRRATVQNAILSFGVVLLLVAVMVVLAEANRRSRRLAKSQQEFIATVTHELKTPLAVISSAAQNLTDGLIRDQRKAEQYGTMIRKEALRLGVSIEHFLLYSNTNSVTRAKPERIPVSDLVQSALRFTEEERLLNGFRTEVVMPPDEAFVSGDRIALESVFRNLAQNVLRHAGAGKYLGVIVSVSGGRRGNGRRGNAPGTVTIKVRDKGPGISPREQKNVFEPFMRGRHAINNQIPGNGIGLNLVRRIVNIHGGAIKLESKPDAGSTFIVTLPRAVDAARETAGEGIDSGGV